jgi:hypothetical protein
LCGGEPFPLAQNVGRFPKIGSYLDGWAGRKGRVDGSGEFRNAAQKRLKGPPRTRGAAAFTRGSADDQQVFGTRARHVQKPLFFRHDVLEFFLLML